MHAWAAAVTACGLVMAACGGDDATTAKPLDGSVDDTSNNGDGNGNTDGSGNPDGNNGDGGGNPDGSSSDGGSSLMCGSAPCDTSTNSCCVDINVDAAGVFSCQATACPMGTTALKCASAADCPGTQVCCADANLDPITTQCKASCGAGEAMLCNPSASASLNRCGDAGACSNANIDSWGLPSSYGTCGGVAN